MTESDRYDDRLSNRFEIATLLDERYRLRGDPDRRGDLTRMHDRLRTLLRAVQDDDRDTARDRH